MKKIYPKSYKSISTDLGLGKTTNHLKPKRKEVQIKTYRKKNPSTPRDYKPSNGLGVGY